MCDYKFWAPQLVWVVGSKIGGLRMRVSGGHLCIAEAPTEPTGETTRPTGATEKVLFFTAPQTVDKVVRTALNLIM